MGVLYVVRHGQASFMSEDYDQLSDKGVAQSTALGQYWADEGRQWSHIFVGPCKRHQQTHDAVAAVYKERGLPWPEPLPMPALDEHQGAELLHKALPQLAEQDEEIQQWMTAFSETRNAKAFQKIFEKLTRMWAKEEINPEGVESWKAFRQRIRDGRQQFLSCEGDKLRIAAFTSGGPVGCVTGDALGVDDEGILELSWQVYNTAYAEFLFTDERFTLRRFNVTPHITTRDMLTYR
ncbi:MAG: hypothetical protein CL920_06765 [Deltaproteobacteria bacterium]|nr:hypothetical protein [Deltaproteobacteria bacterium]MBU48383.1 hypothetical protein [Deltaproteobacteria bacterium]|tara:strand:- start:6023 stop:6730 length:708 start_codon:yes stop_codon:yes gene_type:complete